MHRLWQWCPPSGSSQGAPGLANMTLLPPARRRHVLCQGLPSLSNTADAEAGSMNPCSLRAPVTVLLPGTSQGSSTFWAVRLFRCKNITMPFIPWDQWEVCTLHIFPPGPVQASWFSPGHLQSPAQTWPCSSVRHC